MSRYRKAARRIEIPGDVADAAGMPDDLDASALDPYAVPDPLRRRRAGNVYFVAAAITAMTIWIGLPAGLWLMVGGLIVIGIYHYLGGWHLVVREGRALEVSNRAVGFAVGHASANLGFYGWRARPIWNVLVFSADEPPTRRALVRVDATSGDVVEQYAEAVPPGEF
jgi:hypothetical protein